MIVRGLAHRPRTIEELMPPSLAGKLDRLDLLSRKIFAGKLPGERRSKRRGRSVEFDDFRNYTAGDDLRHIDWNVYARLDRLFIKLFREDEDLALHLVVDCSASMLGGEDDAAPSKVVLAHRIAMALSYIGLVNQNRVSVATFGTGERVRQLAPLRGRSGLARVARFLLESFDQETIASGVSRAGNPAERMNSDLRQVAMARNGRGVMVVLSDFLVPGGPESLRPAINAFAAAGSVAFDTYLLQILAPAELDPAKEAEGGLIGDLRLTDAESGEAREVTIAPALVARYKKRLDAYVGGLRDMAASRGLGAFLVPSDTPVETLVLDSLRRGGILGTGTV